MILPLLAVFTFIMGFSAIQKGEVALTRTKNITGTPAKIIGGIIILLSLLMGGVSLLFGVMKGESRNNFGISKPT